LDDTLHLENTQSAQFISISETGEVHIRREVVFCFLHEQVCDSQNNDGELRVSSLNYRLQHAFVLETSIHKVLGLNPAKSMHD